MKVKVALPLTGIEEYRALKNVIYSGNFVSGKNVELFEKKFSKYNNTKYGCAVNSGTSALHLIFESLNLKKNDEVIVPPLTFISSITPLMYLGIIPVFADINKESFCIDPLDVEKKITKKTKAILAVHFAGNSCDMKSLKKICNKNKLFLIEDCAQSHGTEYYKKKVGSLSHASAFSFYSTKHMTTGEGGMVLSNKKKITDKCKQLRNHGLKNRNDHIYLGYNYRMSELNAVIGLQQLKKLDKILNKKIKISKIILKNIKSLNQTNFIVPQFDKNIKHTFFWCPIIFKSSKNNNIKKLIDYFKKLKIEIRYRYYEPLYKQKIFKSYAKQIGNKNFYNNVYLKIAEMLCGNIFGRPNHPLITNKEIKYIVSAIKNFK